MVALLGLTLPWPLAEPVNIQKSFTAKFSKKPHLVITFAPGLPKWIALDAFLVHMLLMNVIDNAVVSNASCLILILALII